MYYHVVANLEGRFSSIEEALSVYNTHTPIVAEVPFTAAFDEDKFTGRICVAERIEDCITGIGVLGRFRRCLSHNEDAFSYEAEGKECYPILIVAFADDTQVYTPTKMQLPDRYLTNELWILQDTIPSSVQLVWFTPESILYEEIDDDGVFGVHGICTEVQYFDKYPCGRHHPWITGRGHILDCSLRWGEE